MTVSLPPEYELLLEAVVHAPCDVADRVRWSQAQWDLTLRLAAWHRLSPVLYGHLAKPDVAPPAVLDSLEQAYLANSARNLLLRASLRQVIEALAAATIPAMLLKGAALIESVYPDPAEREILDLDLLVPAGELDAANEALAAIGFRPARPAAAERDTRAWMRANHIHDPPLVSEDQRAAVELHHHIAAEPHFDIASVWQRARHAGRADHLVPSPEDLLLHVCLHFTRNRAVRSDGALGQICDIARIVEREDVDWELLRVIVGRYSPTLRAWVFLALFAARELGVAVEERAMRELRPPGFDPRVGRQLVQLRVLRSGQCFPVRSLRSMMAPARQALLDGWGVSADAGSLAPARAYLRRSTARLPVLGFALREPRAALADYLLNRQMSALETSES